MQNVKNVKSEKSGGGASTWLEKNEEKNEKQGGQLSWLTIKDKGLVLIVNQQQEKNDSKEEKP